MAVVSSMKALIKSFTKYLKYTIINMFKTTLPTVCKYYSLNTKPFRLYPNSKETKRKVLSKSLSLIADQFFRCDFNNIRFDSKNKKTGMPYSHFIRICGPVFCCCSTFLDLAYCHHILAINRLQIADIILDPTYIKPVEPRRLAVRDTKRGRP